MIENKRSGYLDILRAFSCIMVVYIHSFNIYTYAQKEPPFVLYPINSFMALGVILFFMISGYLSKSLKSKSYIDILKGKVKSLLVPFIIWNIVYVVFEFVGHMILPAVFEDINKWNVGNAILNIFGIPFITPPIYNPLWFVRELFILFIFYPIIVSVIDFLPNLMIVILFTTLLVINIPIQYTSYSASIILFSFCLGYYANSREGGGRKLYHYVAENAQQLFLYLQE